MSSRILLRTAASLAAPLAFAALAAVIVTRLNDGEFPREVFALQTRQLIERAKLVRSAARPDYQAEVLAKLPANPTTGVFYRLDDLLASAQVVEANLGNESPGRRDVAFAFEFDGEPGLRAEAGTTASLAGGRLRVTHRAGGHLRNAQPIAIAKDGIGSIEVRMRADRGKRLRLAWSSEADPEKALKHKVDTPLVADGEFHTYSINGRTALRRGLSRGDQIRSFFVVVSDAAEANVEVEYIRFLTKQSRYADAPRGVLYESVGAETRRALYMLPAQTIEYALAVPEQRPRLAFGTAAIAPEGGTLSLRVEVVDEDRAQVIYESSIGESSSWNDEKISLAPWAGRLVRLRLGVVGSRAGAALWSNPIVYARPTKPFRAIVMLEDTLRADHLSTHGYTRATSPFRDQLMREHGVVLLYATSQATKTRPSVPSMMTSLLPSTTGVWTFADTLREEYLTLAEVMRSQGFATASFVQNGNAGPYAGLHQGFEAAFDAELIGSKTDEILAGAILWDWIERNRDRNFILYLHLIDPHGPFDPPERFRDWYAQLAPGDDRQRFEPDLDASWVEEPTKTGREALYDGEIRRNDDDLEEFFGRLRAEGLFDHTAFVLVSDHGEHFGEHGLFEHRPPGTLQVTHVPLSIVYPERFGGGQRVDTSVQLMDVMPTLLELAEIDIEPIVMQGDSLVGLIEGDEPRRWRDRVTVSEEVVFRERTEPKSYTGRNVQGSLFFRDWHLIASSEFQGWGGWIPASLSLRVYDFRNDPQEQAALLRFVPDFDLRSAYVSLLGELQATSIEAGEQWVSKEEQAYRFDADVLDQLEELGYAE